jgi:pyruvate dehydrogenase E2 component (dihydrolipoamide acetyltransferase)
MPALEMAQDSGKLIQWLKPEGAGVHKGEALMEIETDKVTVEIEAPADGVLAGVRASPGEDVPVGQVIAWILAPGEAVPAGETVRVADAGVARPGSKVMEPAGAAVSASPVALRMAAQHGLDLLNIKPGGGRIEKADVEAYLAEQKGDGIARRVAASPKARRLAAERGLSLEEVVGSGPEGAILAADVMMAMEAVREVVPPVPALGEVAAPLEGVSHVWQVMAERVTHSWQEIPHFYLVRDVSARWLVEWRKEVIQGSAVKVTFTDLLVKAVGKALREHRRVNAMWRDGKIEIKDDVNVGIAVAVSEGLIVPVIRNADLLGVEEIAVRRSELVERAQSGKLRPEDVQGGTFTISNLGMYGVDGFQAIVNGPQSAILAVGRIADRVVAEDGQAVVRPMMTMTLSCDHRVIDGARGAQFLERLTKFLEQPLLLL